MRLKQVWDLVPFSAKLNLFWERITFSRITKFYFLFSVLHCFVQIIFQVQAFAINAQAADFLFKLIVQGDAFDPGFSVMSPNDLRFCDSVPASFSTASCQVVWRAGATGNGSVTTSVYGTSESATSSTSTTSSPISTSSTLVTPAVATNAFYVSSSSIVHDTTSTVIKTITKLVGASGPTATPVVAGNHATRNLSKRNDMSTGIITAVDVNGTREVVVDGLGWNHESITLTQRCLFTLNWPVETLDNTKREDVTFVVFQIWVLGMSIVALLNESMPHIIASLLTHVLATAWGGFQIVNTANFHTEFSRLTTNGACGINLIPSYWKDRAAAEIPSLSLNAVALLLSAFLSWRLIKLFGWQTFKRVGASRTINRVYMLVLSLSIAIQLSLFFIVVSIALWIDQLYNGPIGHLATRGTVYKGVLVTVLLLLIPWLSMGWVAVRRELRIPMLIFLVMSFGYLAGWGAMFASTTFRWTFVTWRFFSVITSGSVFLTVITFVLGVVCRVNFGKGLSRYLNAQEPLPGDDFSPVQPDNVTSSDPEKVEFPSARGGIPTFSVAFGKDNDVPPPSQMNFGPPRLGPRFTNPPLEPFDPQPLEGFEQSLNPTTYSKPASGAVDAQSDVDTGSVHLSRQLTNGSQRSFASQKSSASTDSYRSDTSSRNNVYLDRSKRWVIE